MKTSILKLRKSNLRNDLLGFTLLESLLALFLLSIICMLFSASIKNAAIVTNQLKSERQKEWQIFVIQLENELRNCRYENTQINKIMLRNKKNNKQVWIEHKLGKIVKVENGGYQPLLMGVKQVRFVEEDKSVVIKVIFENNLNVTAKWIITREHEYE
ncbi:prepilin-type N-terminal cleavage/methylation domain-containing protein [Enterococcus plantarum]|uniref:Prepilin-type cleavage/methylation domain-containing protein n=1 Tax=Enterococcus plantarum TaxID=1077675 RepID=A0A2W3ZCJ3_9ENTE|nr:competence type IV pilus minor pilin ComGF [Enterococcus plantarum]OEG10061.1 prepilin-type N-terminal cleavage/methylation domain-containing protein [Enterococcus plantarum]PZL74277.1 prepilin-type cleavage/methylation domain-containing protein [Enterococcus plantarum]